MKNILEGCATEEEVAAAPHFSRLTEEQEAHLDKELSKIFGTNTSYGKRKRIELRDERTRRNGL